MSTADPTERRTGNRGSNESARRLRLAEMLLQTYRRLSSLDTLDATLQGLQELARILEVTPPQQCRALAGQAVGLVSAQAVVGDLHAARRSCALGRTPVQRVRLALLGPCDGHFNSAGAASALLRAWHHR